MFFFFPGLACCFFFLFLLGFTGLFPQFVAALGFRVEDFYGSFFLGFAFGFGVLF